MDESLRWKRLEGLACLAAVVVIWVTSSELIQHILDDLSFYKPFFLTFYNTSLFSIYLLGFLFIPSWREHSTLVLLLCIARHMQILTECHVQFYAFYRQYR